MEDTQNNFNGDGTISDVIALRVELYPLSEGKLCEVIVEDLQKICELDVHDFVLGNDLYCLDDHLDLFFLQVLIVFQHQPQHIMGIYITFFSHIYC